jgi:hypothetical protein
MLLIKMTALSKVLLVLGIMNTRITSYSLTQVMHVCACFRVLSCVCKSLVMSNTCPPSVPNVYRTISTHLE